MLLTYKRGDIVMVNFNPAMGHEQGNYRPTVVINSVPLPGNVNLVMPITSKEKTYPLEVKLDDRTKTKGVILCFQIRCIDLNKRKAEVIEKLPQDLLDQCSENIRRLTNDI